LNVLLLSSAPSILENSFLIWRFVCPSCYECCQDADECQATAAGYWDGKRNARK